MLRLFIQFEHFFLQVYSSCLKRINALKVLAGLELV